MPKGCVDSKVRAVNLGSVCEGISNNSSRSETEYFTFRTAELALDIFAKSGLSSQSSHLRILDLCAGTGCISLLLHALLSRSFSRVSILGIDISHEAVRLAERNIQHNLRLGLLSDRALSEIQFRQGDFLRQQDEIDTWIREAFSDCSSPLSTSHPRPNSHDQGTKCDILISNPPYVSSLSYQDGTTSRSVRRYEPKVALVPPVGIHSPISERYAREDLFYHHILLLSFRLSTKLTVLECGDYAQAERVSALCRDFAAVEGLTNEMAVEIWDSGEPDSDDVGFLGPQAVVVRRRGL